MTIGIILNPYSENKPAGLGRYILEVSRSLIESDSENHYILYVKGSGKRKPEIKGGNWEFVELGDSKSWMENLSSAPGSDVYIFNTPVMPMKFKPSRSIVIALDYAYLRFKEKGFINAMKRYVLKLRHKRSLHSADHVVSISRHTKNETMRIFDVSGEKISVIYPGFNSICNIAPKDVKLSEKYFLYVGVIKERKNLLNIVKAFAEFKKEDKTDVKLVVVGKGSGRYFSEIKRSISENQIESEVIFTEFVDDSELSFIYQNAQALVFPSLEEGFGFPVLEAMQCNIPVITSNKSSLIEVAGDAGILVDPDNPAEISEALRKISNDSSLRGELIRKGNQRIQEFSWQKCASEFRELITKITQ